MVFAGGAFDDHSLEGTVGGVLLDHPGAVQRLFSEEIPELLMKKLWRGQKAQFI